MLICLFNLVNQFCYVVGIVEKGENLFLKTIINDQFYPLFKILIFMSLPGLLAERYTQFGTLVAQRIM